VKEAVPEFIPVFPGSVALSSRRQARLFRLTSGKIPIPAIRAVWCPRQLRLTTRRLSVLARRTGQLPEWISHLKGGFVVWLNGRWPLAPRDQMPVTGSCMISKSPWSMINSSGGSGSDPGVAKRSKQPVGEISSRTSGQRPILAVRAMCRQRPLWPTTRRRAPRSECPLEGKHRTLVVVAHAGTHRRQIPPPILCGFTPPLTPFPAAGKARPLEIVFNRAVRPYAPRRPVEFEPIRTHFARRRP
jgi:hypothetical protein